MTREWQPALDSTFVYECLLGTYKKSIYCLLERKKRDDPPASPHRESRPLQCTVQTINTPPARTDWPHTRRTDPKQPDPKYDQPRMERRAKQETATTDIFSHGRTCTHSARGLCLCAALRAASARGLCARLCARGGVVCGCGKGRARTSGPSRV